ncbi:DUF1801 domain-containing protein [Cellulomonas cellasea]|uniref:iron chaperone n=1 Tax=Cellulomonas cellasea TaxID=43670 RepID=UPI0025A46453|nr:DUF1801 domain-containing protein [Cellulomonas cellasea]MDM8083172.1 DUF1801 domain-containing protein [Cellulomonas cellasea]
MTDDVEAYFASAPEPHRTTLLAMRATLAELLPEAVETISYGLPTFTVGGKGVAGIGFAARHCQYLPMSGAVTTTLADQLTGYSTSKGAVRVPVDAPLPRELLAALVEARLTEIAAKRG